MDSTVICPAHLLAQISTLDMEERGVLFSLLLLSNLHENLTDSNLNKMLNIHSNKWQKVKKSLILKRVLTVKNQYVNLHTPLVSGGVTRGVCTESDKNAFAELAPQNTEIVAENQEVGEKNEKSPYIYIYNNNIYNKYNKNNKNNKNIYKQMDTLGELSKGGVGEKKEGEGKSKKGTVAPPKKNRVGLEELKVSHVANWLAEKRSQGKYIHHDEHAILEGFKDYCLSTGKKYEDYTAAYRNAFGWERFQPKAKPAPASKDDRARDAVTEAAKRLGLI